MYTYIYIRVHKITMRWNSFGYGKKEKENKQTINYIWNGNSF